MASNNILPEKILSAAYCTRTTFLLSIKTKPSVLLHPPNKQQHLAALIEPKRTRGEK